MPNRCGGVEPLALRKGTLAEPPAAKKERPERNSIADIYVTNWCSHRPSPEASPCGDQGERPCFVRILVGACVLLFLQSQVFAESGIPKGPSTPSIPGTVGDRRPEPTTPITPTRPKLDAGALQACLDRCARQKRQCERKITRRDCGDLTCRSDCRRMHALEPSPKLPQERKPTIDGLK